MSLRFNCLDGAERLRGLARAETAVADGGLVVLPTDTVYGIGADAFSPEAVGRLHTARNRVQAPPVLVRYERTLDGIATRVPDSARALAAAFWPGGLTLRCHRQPTLGWDLGDDNTTVSIRMPAHPLVLALVEKTGPLALTGASRAGLPPAVNADEAWAHFGDAVEVYLDGGTAPGGELSTVVDVTGDAPRVLRLGAVGLEALRDVAQDLVVPDAVLPGSGG